MTTVIEHLIPARCRLGEGPLWNPDEQALYWLDIRQQRAGRCQPATGDWSTYQLEARVTALGLRKRGGFVAATTIGLGFLSPRLERLHIIHHPEEGLPDQRFNDGAVDPAGRFWAGSMYEGPADPAPAVGKLYCLSADGSVAVRETGLTISNGIGWSPDGKTMYFTDSPARVIYACDFDPVSGETANRRIFVHTPESPDVPDGLAVDSQGFVWSARWGGWKINRHDPQGRVEREIRLPVKYPTSCVFGGPGMDELYITSAAAPLSVKEQAQQPLAGDLFRYRPGVRGQAANRFAG